MWFEGFFPQMTANDFFSTISNLLQNFIFLMSFSITNLILQAPKWVNYGQNIPIILQPKKKISRNLYKCGFQKFLPGYQGCYISKRARQNLMIYSSFNAFNAFNVLIHLHLILWMGTFMRLRATCALSRTFLHSFLPSPCQALLSIVHSPSISPFEKGAFVTPCIS